MDDTQIITIIIAIVGVIIGSVSITKQFWKERPRFTYKIKNIYWHTPEQNNNPKWYTINSELLLKNEGERTTAVYSISISFIYKNKHYDYNDSKEIILNSGEAKTEFLTFSINQREIEIDSDLTDVTLKIQYTHGVKKQIIPIIKQRS